MQPYQTITVALVRLFVLFFQSYKASKTRKLVPATLNDISATFPRGSTKGLTSFDVLWVATVLVCDGVVGGGKMRTNCSKMNKIAALLIRLPVK